MEISRFACKLKLIHYGMLKESQQLDDVVSAASSSSVTMTNGLAAEDEEGEDDASDTDDYTEKMKAFTKRVIEADWGTSQVLPKFKKTEAIAEERRNVIKGFLAAIRKPKSCGRCKG